MSTIHPNIDKPVRRTKLPTSHLTGLPSSFGQQAEGKEVLMGVDETTGHPFIRCVGKVLDQGTFNDPIPKDQRVLTVVPRVGVEQTMDA